jgi:serine/threonine protein kinase
VLVDSYRRARIADFGHTVSMMSTALPSSAWQSGTAAYMAPELYETSVDSSGTEQSRRPDAYSDVFALAMLMWEVRPTRPRRRT